MPTDDQGNEVAVLDDAYYSRVTEERNTFQQTGGIEDNTPNELKPYTTAQGTDLVRALEANVQPETLGRAGFSGEQISKAAGLLEQKRFGEREYNAALGQFVQQRNAQAREEAATLETDKQQREDLQQKLAPYSQASSDTPTGQTQLSYDLGKALEEGRVTREELLPYYSAEVLDTAERQRSEARVNEAVPTTLHQDTLRAYERVQQGRQDIFERTHVKTPLGEYIRVDDFTKLPPELQRVVLQQGLAPIEAANALPTAAERLQAYRSLGIVTAPAAQPLESSYLPMRYYGSVADTLKELGTLGKIETDTYNKEELSAKYAEAERQLRGQYQLAEAEANKQGTFLNQTQEEFLRSNLPSEQVYVQTILALQPQLSSIAKEVGLSSIPIYGTIRTFRDEDAGQVQKALAISSDALFFIPLVRAASAAARAGTSFTKAAGQIAVAELTAPITLFTKPGQTARAAFEPFETFLVPKKIPVDVLEVKTHTIRLPVLDSAPRSPFTASGDPLATPFEAMTARQRLTQQAIAGEPSISLFGRQIASIQSPALQKVTGPAFVTSTPDLRNWYSGIEVVANAKGEGLFVAPGRMERFVQATSSGRPVPISEAAQAGIKKGLLPDKPVKGTVIVRDPKLIALLEDSRKLYRGGAEIEAVLPPGTKIPPPSQVLHTRNPLNGERTQILVIGKPFTPTEIAALKFIGTPESIRQIFQPSPGSITNTGLTNAGKQIKQAMEGIEEARKLRVRAKATTGTRATKLEAQANRVEARSRAKLDTAYRAYNSAALSGILRSRGELVTTYTGGQDVSGAYEALSRARPKAESTRAGLAVEKALVDRLDTRSADTRLASFRTELPGSTRVPDTDYTSFGSDENRSFPDNPPEISRIYTPDDPRTPFITEDPRPDLPPELLTPPPPPDSPRIFIPEPDRPGIPIPVRPGIPTGTPGTPEIRGPLLPRIAPALSSLQDKRRRSLEPMVVTWKQDMLYIGISGPPFVERNISYSESPFLGPNVRRVSGPRAAWNRIKRETRGSGPDANTFDEFTSWVVGPNRIKSL